MQQPSPRRARRSWMSVLAALLLATSGLPLATTPAAAAAPVYDQGAINDVLFDGTGHGTADQAFVTSANGFVPGDDAPRDGVVATQDTVGYAVRLRFNAGPRRTVRVLLEAPGLTTRPGRVGSMCVSGVGFTASGTDLDCTFTIQGGAVASIDASVALLATDAAANTTVTARLTVGATTMAPASPVRVVSAPALDVVLAPTTSSSVVNSTTGTTSFQMLVNNVTTPRFNPTKGYYRPATLDVVFTSPNLPDGTTITVGGRTGTFSGGRATVTGITTPPMSSTASPTSQPVAVTVKVPSGAYPTALGQPTATYQLAATVDPQQVRSGTLLNNGTGVQPGNGEASSHVTDDPARNIQRGLQFPNNDWAQASYAYEDIPVGNIISKSNHAPGDTTQSIFEPGNRVYADWNQPGTRNLQPRTTTQFPADYQVAARTQFEARLMVDTQALSTSGGVTSGTAPQLAVCDTWQPGQSYDPSRPVVVTTGTGKVVSPSLYTVEFGSTGCQATSGWSATATSATTTVRVSFASGVLKAGSGTWLVRLPMSSPDVVTAAQHLSLVADTATVSSTEVVLKGGTAPYVRNIQLVAPQPAVLQTRHETTVQSVNLASDPVPFTISPTLGRVAVRPDGGLTVQGTLTLDPCLTGFTPDPSDGWTATVTRGTAVCGQAGGTRTTVALSYSGNGTYDAANQLLSPPPFTYTGRPSALAANGTTLTSTVTLTSSLTGTQQATAAAGVTYVAPVVTSQSLEAVESSVEKDADLAWRAQFFASNANNVPVVGTVILPRSGDQAVTEQLSPDSLAAYQATGGPTASSMHGSHTLTGLALDPDNTTPGSWIEVTTDPTVGTGTDVTWVRYDPATTDLSTVTGARAVMPDSPDTTKTASLLVTIRPSGNAVGDQYLVNTDPMTVDGATAAAKTWPVVETVMAGSISGTIWWDDGNDSYRDAAEPGVAGATVSLRTPAGDVVATTTTDATGAYHFDDLVHGTYAVVVTRTAEMTSTTTKYGTQVPVVQTYSWDGERFALARTTSDTITLAVGGTQPGVDFGFFRPAPSMLLDKRPATINCGLSPASCDVTWDVLVTNNGNVTATTPVISDRMESSIANVTATVEVQSGVPTPLRVTAAGAGDAVGYYLMADGTVCKGTASCGPGGSGTLTGLPTTKAVAGYGSQVFLLGSDGVVRTTQKTSLALPCKVIQLDVGAINSSAGFAGTCADGSIVTGPAAGPWTLSRLPGGVNAAKVVRGDYGYVAVGADGVVYGLGGDNGTGSFGLGGLNNFAQWTKLPQPAGGGVVDVVSGGSHTWLINGAGEVFASGSFPNAGETGGTTAKYTTWTRVTLPGPVRTISSSRSYGANNGAYTALFLFQNGTVARSGNLDPYNICRVDGQPCFPVINPTIVDGVSGVTSVAAGPSDAFFVRDDGSMLRVGTGINGVGPQALAPTVMEFPPTLAVTVARAAVAPISQSTSGGFTTRTYQSAVIQPGTTVVYHLTGTVQRTTVDQYRQNMAWLNTDQTPVASPSADQAVTAGNYRADGLLKPDGTREVGLDGDLVDGTPVRVPALSGPVGSLSGRVWEDTDRDGMRLAGEPARAGSVVELLSGTNLVASTTTAADGTYSFTNLPAGTYAVQFHADGPSGGRDWKYTVANASSDPALGSRAPLNGLVSGIQVTGGVDTPNINAGVVTTTAALVVGKVVNGADGLVLPLDPATGRSKPATVTITVTNPATATEKLTGFALADATLQGPAAGTWVWRDAAGAVIGSPAAHQLDVGQSLTITGILPAMDAGSIHRDDATVTASSLDTGTPVTAHDPSDVSVVAAAPSISVKKYFDDTAAPGLAPSGSTARGQLSDAQDGTPVHTSTGTVTASYVVTNTGNQPLYSVQLAGERTGTVTHTFPSPLLPGSREVFTAATREQVPATGQVYSSPVVATAVTHDAAGDPATGVRATDQATALPVGLASVEKYGADGTRMAGSTFTLAPADGHAFADGTTAAVTLQPGDTGTTATPVLVLGASYVLTETVAPQGSQLLARPVVFTPTSATTVAITSGGSRQVTASGTRLLVTDPGRFELPRAGAGGGRMLLPVPLVLAAAGAALALGLRRRHRHRPG